MDARYSPQLRRKEISYTYHEREAGGWKRSQATKRHRHRRHVLEGNVGWPFRPQPGANEVDDLCIQRFILFYCALE